MPINSLIIFIIGFAVEYINSHFLAKNIKIFKKNKKISTIVGGSIVRFIFLLSIFYTIAKLFKSSILILLFALGLTTAKIILIIRNKVKI